MSTTIFAIANQKGGVGKSTTATSMASILRSEGHKVLLIDADPQCNSTDTYRAVTKRMSTLYDVLLEPREKSTISETIQHTEAGDIVPGDDALRLADSMLVVGGDVDNRLLLRNALEEIKDVYDYIVIDTGPALGILLVNVLTAADYVIIPTLATRYSFKGVGDLLKTVTKVQGSTNSDLKVAGFLIVNLESHLNSAKSGVEYITSSAKDVDLNVFNSYIRKDAKVVEAQLKKMPLIDAYPHCRAELDYEEWIMELTDPDSYKQKVKNRK